MIRNIVYLDVEKLYSLSSQIFEGITEYVLRETAKETDQSESQKGPVGSGKVLGDILRHHEKVSEKRFLVDYSYALFEQKLIDDKRVVEVNSSDLQTAVGDQLKVNKFIKVKATVTFNDMSALLHTIVNFNATGRAIAHITSQGERDAVYEELKKIEQEKGKEASETRTELMRRKKILENIEKLAMETGLYQDPKFLENLKYLLDYGYKDQFEVQMKAAGMIFSANLKRDSLREAEALLIRKYARNTEVRFTLFGIIAQHEHDPNAAVLEGDSPGNMKEALVKILSHLSNLEGTFTGRLGNEIIIDPIALYTEVL